MFISFMPLLAFHLSLSYWSTYITEVRVFKDGEKRPMTLKIHKYVKVHAVSLLCSVEPVQTALGISTTENSPCALSHANGR